MELKLEIEASFSLSEGSDIFIHIGSGVGGSEIGYIGLDFEQLLTKSEDLLTFVDEDETITLKGKIETSIKRFQESLNEKVAETAVNRIIELIENSKLPESDKIRAHNALIKIQTETTLHELREFTPTFRMGNKTFYSDLPDLFNWSKTYEPDWFWNQIYIAINE